MNLSRQSAAVPVALIAVPALLLVILVAALPVRASAQEQTCDGNFHIVHRLDINEGTLTDLDFSTPLDGWVVGEQISNRGKPRPFVARFDDSSTEGVVLPRFDPRPTPIAVDALSPIDVWVVGAQRGRSLFGDSFAMHWDGSTWTKVPTPTPGKSSALTAVKAFAPNDVWAVGGWERRGDGFRAATLVLHFDGVSWSRVPSPSPSPGANVLYAIDGSSPTDLWAGGYRGRGRSLVLHWTGSEWSRVQFDGSGGGGIVYGVSAPTATDVWIAGWDPSDSDKSAFAAHWDGAQWQSPPVPNVRGHELLLDVVAEQGQAWAVGARTRRAGLSARAARWDGSAWSNVSVEGGTQFMYAVTGDGAGDIWATAEGWVDAGVTYSVIERACL